MRLSTACLARVRQGITAILAFSLLLAIAACGSGSSGRTTAAVHSNKALLGQKRARSDKDRAPGFVVVRRCYNQ